MQATGTILKDAHAVSLTVTNEELEDVLKQIFKDQPLDYQLTDKSVLVKLKEPSFINKIKDKVEEFIAGIDPHGRVVGDDGLPLSGATVAVKGTNNVTSTDANGYFNLRNVAPDATIVVTFIGFDKQEVKATAEMGTIKMTITESKLDQVQIIAYGQTTQRLTVGNIGAVSANEIAEQPVSNPLLNLEGRVPGLFITENSGIAGGGVKVRIQGQNSIAQGNDPLYVIDGVPYSSQLLTTNFGGTSGSLNGGSPFNFINPDDIESISVLKDADATAIYGSRAANGAILVTTKKGKAGETKVNVNAQQGWGQVGHFLDLMNTQQYVQMRFEALKNDGIASPSATDYDINGLWNMNSYTNWQKVLIGGTSHYNDYNASVSGGTETTQYLVGATFHRETSVFPGDFDDAKGAIHFNINSASKNQKFHIQFSGNYLMDNNQLPGSASGDLTATAITTPPNAPSLYNPDGSLNWALNAAGTATWANPIAVTLQPYQSKTNNLIANTVLSYKIIKNLEIKSSFGYTNMQLNETDLGPLIADAPSTRATATRGASYTYNNVNSWIIEPQAHYQQAIGRGKLDVLVGMTIQQQNSNGLNLHGSGYNSDAVLLDPHSATTVTVNSSVISQYKYNAGFGRLNYTWEDKYILDLTARRDGSSRFGDQNQFHDFGSIGVGWIFSDENFMKSSLPFLSFGKLRGSYGTTGNDQIGDYTYLNLYTPLTYAVPYQNSTSLKPAGLPNPYLQWELTKKLQAGLDLGFFKDRILLTANYVYNRSSNELLSYVLPLFTGFGSITENFPATIQNTAWEITLNTINIKTNAFNWSSNFNLTIPENKVVSFPNFALSGYASGQNGVIVGQPIGIKKAYQFLGVDPATGNYEFSDSHGNPTSNPNATTDETALVNLQPKFYGGLQNSFSYKQFKLDVFFQFVKQLGVNYYFGAIPGYVKNNEPVSVLSRWQEPGDITSIQRYNTNLSNYTQLNDAKASNAAYSDASYIRLKNVSLSYQLPSVWQQKMHVESCRVYLQGQNLLTFTKFQGMDPENQSITSLPPLRMMTVGLQVGL